MGPSQVCRRKEGARIRVLPKVRNPNAACSIRLIGCSELRWSVPHRGEAPVGDLGGHLAMLRPNWLISSGSDRSWRSPDS